MDKNKTLKGLEAALENWKQRGKRGEIDEPDGVFESVERGLAEGIAWARGENTGVKEHRIPIPEVNVSGIRKRTKLSQAEFARSIGIGKATLVNWEQGRRTPQGPARVLLALIERDPKIVMRNLAK